MAVDAPLRRALARSGVRFMTESAVLRWDGKLATITSLLDGNEQTIEADSLVFATTNGAEDSLPVELERRGIAYSAIGDCTASRQAAFAFHDGRRIALEL